jgi:hypothetical protein
MVGGSILLNEKWKERIVGFQPLKIGKKEMPQREILSTIEDANIHLFYEKTK